MQKNLLLLILIFVLCFAPGIITVAGRSDRKFTINTSIDESVVGLTRRHSLRHIVSAPSNGNPHEQIVENAKEINSERKQRNLEQSHTSYSEHLFESNWNETIPDVSAFFELTTICAADKECTCEVIFSSGEKCGRCYICGLMDGVKHYSIDCRNIFPFDHPCPVVNCMGDCITNHVPPPEVNEMAAVVIVLTMILVMLLGTSPCCVAIFCPSEGRGSRQGRVGMYPSITPMPQDPEIRQGIIDSCLSTRTLTSSDPLVCKRIKDIDESTTKDELSQHGIELSMQKIVFEETSDDPCQICLDLFKEGNKVSSSLISKCNHEFHHDCITEWLKLHETCPTCRDKFISQDEVSNSHP